MCDCCFSCTTRSTPSIINCWSWETRSWTSSARSPIWRVSSLRYRDSCLRTRHGPSPTSLRWQTRKCQRSERKTFSLTNATLSLIQPLLYPTDYIIYPQCYSILTWVSVDKCWKNQDDDKYWHYTLIHHDTWHNLERVSKSKATITEMVWARDKIRQPNQSETSWNSWRQAKKG